MLALPEGPNTVDVFLFSPEDGNTSSLRNVVFYGRFEAFTAVTMKNVVFWDIKTHFIPHRRHITSPLHSPAS
jgi:hypothetical protein